MNFSYALSEDFCDVQNSADKSECCVDRSVKQWSDTYVQHFFQEMNWVCSETRGQQYLWAIYAGPFPKTEGSDSNIHRPHYHWFILAYCKEKTL